MYSVNKKKKFKKTSNFSSVGDLEKLNSFLMPSRQGGFIIVGQTIKSIRIYHVEFSRPMVTRLVDKKYKKLISFVTELLISDDDSGEAFRLALTEMEKFRQEIKNKYRVFLEQEELNLMAKQLSALQLEAKNLFAELQNSFMHNKSSGKNR